MIISEFADALSYLEQFIPDPKNKLAGNIGFKRMKILCGFLGNPQFSYKTIHVGGTSGKGSTATFIASILGTKYKTGLYTSPHLTRVNERIKIINNFQFPISNFQSISNFQFQKQLENNWQNSNISDSLFINLLNNILPVIEEMRKMKLGAPSYFEIVTAMSFLYFKLQKVDIAVIEVGMGGKYDATNVVKPLVSVITNIGLDHMEFLGETIEKIAEEKAGIIKHKIQVVSGVKQKDVIKVIESRITNPWPRRGEAGGGQESRGSLMGKDFNYDILSINEKGCSFNYSGNKVFKNLKIGMVGKHQIENASLAIRTIEQLSVVSYQLSEKNIRNGLQSAFIPGRFEIIREDPYVILDGAHNPDKIQALVNTVQTVFPGKRATLIIAIKNDKNAKEMISQILLITEKLIVTEYEINNDLGKVRSYKATDLSGMIRDLNGQMKLEVIRKPIDTLKSAIKVSGKENIILVTGSLYLVGEIKKYYEN
jgi:dihydrofolate synthase / folylpolyglutamate synthase